MQTKDKKHNNSRLKIIKLEELALAKMKIMSLYSLTFMSFQTCMTYFLPVNTKDVRLN